MEILTDKTCQFKNDNGELVCSREIYQDEDKCIFHSQIENKDVIQFQMDLKSSYEKSGDVWDLSDVIFPKDFEFKDYVIDKKVYFKDSIFLGTTTFQNIIFRDFVSFANSLFKGTTYFRDISFKGIDFDQESNDKGFREGIHFDNVIFEEHVNFRNTYFRKVADFFETEFLSSANFYKTNFDCLTRFIRATFDGNIFFRSTIFKDVIFSTSKVTNKSSIIFDGENEYGRNMFVDKADFSNVVLDNPKRLTFRKVSLEKCLFLETDVSLIKFHDVTWPEKRITKRKYVYDEISPDERWLNRENSPQKSNLRKRPRYDYNLIAHLYRRLQANYDFNYQYPEAGDFYFGEQEMIRRAKKRPWRYISPNYIYLICSRYGQSWIIPLIWILLILILSSFVLLLTGVNLNNMIINQDLNSSGELFLFQTIYWSIFSENLRFVIFDFTKFDTILQDPFQRIYVVGELFVVIGLFTLFLLALRRKFKRKSY